MSAKQIRIATISFALLVSILIVAIKFYAAHIADSTALRSDALEGIANILAAAVGLGSILFAEKPADKNHPYGHGKIEFFASAIEGGLISGAGVLIIGDALVRIFHPHPLEDLNLGLKLNIAAGLMNGVLGLLVYGVGKKFQSHVLKADGIHLLTDLITTVSLAVGLGIMMATGWTWIDPLLAFGVAAFLLKIGIKLIIEASNALLDGESPALLNTIVEKLNRIERGQVIAIHELKAQQFGRDHHIDMHVVVPEYMSIKEAHKLSDRLTFLLGKEMSDGSLIHAHIDPCHRLYCSKCPIQECTIRKEAFVAQDPYNLDSVTQLDQQDN